MTTVEKKMPDPPKKMPKEPMEPPKKMPKRITP